MLKTTMESPVKIILSRKGQVIFNTDLRELVLFAFLRGFNPSDGEILAKMTGDFRKECIVIAKVTMAGEEFVLELPEVVDSKRSHS